MTGLRRYRNKRDASEASIVAALEGMGCHCYRMDKPVDLLVFIPRTGDLLLVECKTGKGKLTADQSALMAKGWEVWILRNAADAVTLFNMVRRMAA